MIIALLHQATPVVAPPAPPIVTTSRAMAPMLADERRQSIIAVEVRGGGVVLWEGDLRVAANAQSTVRQTQSEPAGQSCRDNAGYRPPLETGLTVTLQPVHSSTDDGQFRVTVRWIRAGTDACPVAGITRTVELNATAELSPDQPIVLEGDAGLKVRLRLSRQR